MQCYYSLCERRTSSDTSAWSIYYSISTNEHVSAWHGSGPNGRGRVRQTRNYNLHWPYVCAPARALLGPFPIGCNDAKLNAGLSRRAGVQSTIYERADERAACSGRREVNESNATESPRRCRVRRTCRVEQVEQTTRACLTL